MTTRSTARKNLFLHEKPSIVPEPSSPLAMTRRRQTRRQKENEQDETNDVGKFVKYPQETPAKKTCSEAEQKSTRGTRNTLKEKNISQDESNLVELPEKIVDVEQSNKRVRKTRNGNTVEDVQESKTKKTYNKKNNKTKAVLDKTVDKNGEKEPKEIVENLSDNEVQLRKSKRKGKSKKTKLNSATPEVTSIDETDRTAGGFVKPLKLNEFNMTNANTSADSFHSATSSPPADNLNSSTYGKKTRHSPSSVSVGKNRKSSTPNTMHQNKSAVNVGGVTHEILNTTFDKTPERRSSRIGNQNIGKISEDIFNTSIVLVESSLDNSETLGNNSKIQSRARDSEDDNKNILNETFDKPTDDKDKTANENTHHLNTRPLKLIREGTFTKDSPDVANHNPLDSNENKDSTETIASPKRAKKSLSAPGSTPFHSQTKRARSGVKSTSFLNLTQSLEKEKRELRRSSTVAEVVRPTKVMFCSPKWNAVRDTERKSKIIKSSLKGSNKSFLYEEPSPVQFLSSRKRSYTQGDADTVSAKRKKLGEEINNSVNRLSRPRVAYTGKDTQSGANKEPVTPKCKPPLRKSLSETKPASVRSKLPNFSALHRKAFDRMESLTECQERKARRAQNMLNFTSSGSYSLDGRRSPQVKPVEGIPVRDAPGNEAGKKQDSSVKPKQLTKPASDKQTDAKLNSEKSYTRFGFKLNTDFNPFSIPSAKPTKSISNPLNIPTAETTKSSKLIMNNMDTTTSRVPRPAKNIVKAKLNRTVPSLRREKSKQALTRETSSTVIVEKRKKENRDIIKGVRTNRRFELQMQCRK